MRTLQIIQSQIPKSSPDAPAASFEDGVAEGLRTHLALCEDILVVVEKESQAMQQPEPGDMAPLAARKKSLLPRLNQSLDQLKQHRLRWQQLVPAERARHPEIGGLLRQTQDLIMKIIMLDRENEQSLLRKGMIPVQQLPSAQRQQAHFVTELYRRQGAKG